MSEAVLGLREKYAKIPEERFFREIFKSEEYKPVKREPQVIIDVGALAGEFSAYIYDQAEVIYALEPHSEHFKELEENVQEFGLDKIKPVRIALSDYNGKGELIISVRGGHRLTKESGSPKTEKVEVKTLATFMKDNNIKHVDILKIDVENSEDLIFTSEDFKEVADRIEVIIGEHLSGIGHILVTHGFREKNHGVNTVYTRI